MNYFEISFPKSKSMGHATAVDIAQNATEYEKITIDDQVFHKAKFDLNFYDQACHAFEIAKLTAGLSGVLIRVGGTIAPTVYGQYIWIIDILKCYVQSLKCADFKAHCWQVVTLNSPNAIDLSSIKNLFYIEDKNRKQIHICYPCSHVLVWRQEINFYHPATLKDQIQAITVKGCVDWCPALRLEEAFTETENLNNKVFDTKGNTGYLMAPEV